MDASDIFDKILGSDNSGEDTEKENSVDNQVDQEKTVEEPEGEPEKEPEDGEQPEQPEEQEEQPEGVSPTGKPMLVKDKIDYPNEKGEDKEMGDESKKLPELEDLKNTYNEYSQGEHEPNNESVVKKSGDKLEKILSGSVTRMMEKIKSEFEKKFPEHNLLGVTSKRLYSEKDGETFEVDFEYNKDSVVKFFPASRREDLDNKEKIEESLISSLFSECNKIKRKQILIDIVNL